MFYNVFHLFWPPKKLWLMLVPTKLKATEFLQKHCVIHFRMARHGEHLSINSYLSSNFQCQIKKIGITEDASDTALLGTSLGGFANFMQLFYVIVPQCMSWNTDDQCIHWQGMSLRKLEQLKITSLEQYNVNNRYCISNNYSRDRKAEEVPTN